MLRIAPGWRPCKARPVAAAFELLQARLERRVDPAAWQTFARTLEGLRPTRARERSANHAALQPLLSAFSGAARLLGRAPLDAEDETIPGPHEEVPLAGFSVDIAARCLLLLAFAEAAGGAQLEDGVWSAYREGDTLEKIAVVRSLPLLSEQAQFLELSLDAGRTNDARLFRAVACDTPFPARHYPELEWNKLFMKAAFVRAPLDRIVGLARRENPELARMALEFIEEQESAGRPFPPGIWLGIAPFPPPGAVAKMLGYASHSVAEVRLGAIAGLLRASQPRTESFLRERLTVESDASARDALARCLERLNGVAKN